MEMQYRNLGRSGLMVSALSLGSWVTFGKQVDIPKAKEMMSLAYDNGINFFDNAEVYAHGESERIMGEVLKDLAWDRSTYIVSSKVFFGRGGKWPTQRGLSRKHVTEACHEALERLQVEYLDLFFCHRPDKSTPIEETVWAMNTLIQQGKIFYWGTSEWSAQEITEAHAAAHKLNLIGPLMEQPQYNMFHREKFEVGYSQLYKNFGMGTTIWSPLYSGLLTGKYSKGIPKGSRLAVKGYEWLKDSIYNEEKIAIVKKLSRLAKKLGISVTNMALAWCLKNQHVSTVILGASKTSQLEENLQSLEAVELLTDDVMAKIEKILGNKPEQPIF